MFFLLYKHADDGIFDDFPKISDHFPKIFQNCSKGQTNAPEQIPKFSEDVWRLPKIAEDFQGRPEDVQWYTNEFKCSLRDKLDISEIIDIFTCEDILSFLSICYHSLYHWLLYNKSTCTPRWRKALTNKLPYWGLNA